MTPELTEYLQNFLVSAAPAITAILGVVITCISVGKKIYAAIADFRKDETLKELNQKVNSMLVENQRLNTVNRQLLVELTKIANYTDVKDVQKRLSNIRRKGDAEDDKEV